MSVILFIVGAIAIMAGAALIGFGIPINEFSFGNTLIAAGVTAFMGGLIIIALGAVVAQLQRVAEALAVRPPLRAGKPMEPFEQGAARGTAAGRIPFPPKPKMEPRPPELAPGFEEPHEMPADAGLAVAPTMRNPDEAALSEAEEVPAQQADAADKAAEPVFDAGWRAPPPLPPLRTSQTSFFESMWPAPERSSKAATTGEPKLEAKSKYEPKSEFSFEAKPETKPDFEFEPKMEVKPEPLAPQPAAPPMLEGARLRSEGEPRAVAILKSGVVDGMGYTLYVDGSIEAELPQGTLRFASINELRSHLEKNS